MNNTKSIDGRSEKSRSSLTQKLQKLIAASAALFAIGALAMAQSADSKIKTQYSFTNDAWSRLVDVKGSDNPQEITIARRVKIQDNTLAVVTVVGVNPFLYDVTFKWEEKERAVTSVAAELKTLLGGGGNASALIFHPSTTFADHVKSATTELKSDGSREWLAHFRKIIVDYFNADFQQNANSYSKMLSLLKAKVTVAPSGDGNSEAFISQKSRHLGENSIYEELAALEFDSSFSNTAAALVTDMDAEVTIAITPKETPGADNPTGMLKEQKEAMLFAGRPGWPKYTVGIAYDTLISPNFHTTANPASGGTQTYTWSNGPQATFKATPFTLYHVPIGHSTSEWAISLGAGIGTGNTGRLLVGVSRAMGYDRRCMFTLGLMYGEVDRIDYSGPVDGLTTSTVPTKAVGRGVLFFGVSFR